MKYSVKRRFITMPTVIFLVVITVLSSMATYAWFAMNKAVEEETFGMSVKVTPNLIITKDESGIEGLTAEYTEIKEPFPGGLFTPASHYATEEGTRVSLGGLYCLSSDVGVDRTTGSPEKNADQLAENEEGGKTYFVDYVIYVAATDATIENVDLSVALLPITDTLYSTSDCRYAASVDVYLGSYTEANFKGTLNLAGLDALTNTGTVEKTSLRITDLPQHKIPQNTDGYLKVCMRCYFDGGLCYYDSDGEQRRCFVNSEDIKSDGVQFKISLEDVKR